MINSLKGRLLVFNLALLLGFMFIVGFVLEQIFFKSQLSNMQEQLKLHGYAILAVTDQGEGVIDFPTVLSERRFNQVGSGLYAQYVNKNGKLEWYSYSAQSLPPVTTNWANPGYWEFGIVSAQANEYLIARIGVSWQLTKKRESEQLNLVVMQNLQSLKTNDANFRKTLRILLTLTTIVLIVIQLTVLRWGLRPLRTVSNDLEKLQRGEQVNLEGKYPKELTPLTSNLNRLLKVEHGQRERYRNTLADLSHSLKTPLAVLSGLIEKRHLDRNDQSEMAQQVERMTQTIRYQLQRAVGSGRATHMTSHEVSPIIQSIGNAMKKVYAEKSLDLEFVLNDDIRFYGDRNDLMEVIGNIFDNACKYGSGKVRVSTKKEKQQWSLSICDDGQGVPADKIAQILKRGVRLDSFQAGQGLGLGLVKDIVDSYDAVLEVGQSSLGGSKFKVTFFNQV